MAKTLLFQNDQYADCKKFHKKAYLGVGAKLRLVDKNENMNM